MSRYHFMFRRLAVRGEGAFGAFVMLGDPDFDQSLDTMLRLVDAGADMLEVGIPFSDPIADGPVIQAAAQRALAAGINPARCFALIDQVRRRLDQTPIGILTYANIAEAWGRDDFYAAAAASGADSILLADVPLTESAPYVEAANASGVCPVLIAAANTPTDRLHEIAAASEGYIYCVSRAGVTGADDRLAFNHGSMLATLKAAGSAPPIFGFGVSRPDHVRAALDTGAAGVICGSAIVARQAEGRGDALQGFVRDMKAATVRVAAA